MTISVSKDRLHHLETPIQPKDVARRKIDVLLDELRAGIDLEKNQRRLFRRYYRLVCHFFHQRGRAPASPASRRPFRRVPGGGSRIWRVTT